MPPETTAAETAPAAGVARGKVRVALAESPLIIEAPYLRDLILIVGDEKTLLLIEKRGGTRVTIPSRRFSPTSALGRDLELTQDECKKLQQVCGGQMIRVPLLRRWRAKRLRREGYSYTQIARLLGTCEKSVAEYLRSKPCRDDGDTLPAEGLSPRGPDRLGFCGRP
jgi:hypothetical protein